jgi:hypothetical protein
LSIVGGLFSALRGARYVHVDDAHWDDPRHDNNTRDDDVHSMPSRHDHFGDPALTSGAVPGELAMEDDRA